MSSPDFLVAMTPVVEALEQLGVSYYVGGSVASSAYGMARATADVDLIADLHYAHVQPFAEQLRGSYYVEEREILDAIQTRSAFNVIHLATIVKVDVFLPKGRPYDREAQRRVQRETLEETETARSFNLASAEDVILNKLEWYRVGGEVSERQWNDVLGILKVQSSALDRVHLEMWADQLGLADLLARAALEARLE